MNFARIALVLLAVPVWLVKRGFDRVKVGLGLLAVGVLDELSRNASAREHGESYGGGFPRIASAA